MEGLEASKFRSFIPFCNMFLLYVLQNKIYMIKVKKQNGAF